MVQVGYTVAHLSSVSTLLTPPVALGSVNRIETCTSVCNLYLIYAEYTTYHNYSHHILGESVIHSLQLFSFLQCYRFQLLGSEKYT